MLALVPLLLLLFLALLSDPFAYTIVAAISALVTLRRYSSCTLITRVPVEAYENSLSARCSMQ